MASYFKVSLIPKYIGYNQYVDYRTEIINLIECKTQYKLPEIVEVLDVAVLEKLTNIVLSNAEIQCTDNITELNTQISEKDNTQSNKEINLQNLYEPQIEPPGNKVESDESIIENLILNLAKQMDKDTLIGALNCNYGSNNEENVIDKIKEKYGYDVIENNAKCYTKVIDDIKICGRVDGFIIIDGVRYLVEIKSRKNRIFKNMPSYEKVQILLYTKLCECDKVIYIQNHGDKLDLQIFEDFKDEKMFKEIMRRLKCVKKCINGEPIKEVCYW